MIDFNHTALQAKRLRQVILANIKRVIESGIFLEGKENLLLQKKMIKFLGNSGYCITVASGHDALLLSVAALRLKPKDEVIFPANAYPTAFPLCLLPLRPIPADVDQNGQLCPRALAAAISPRTKAVVITHLYGLVGQLEQLLSLCRKNRLIVIEDCAQAFGSTYQKQPVGTFGDFGCFSFYPTKNLGTLGDGGAIWTKRASYYHWLKLAKSYGEKVKYRSLFVSGHSRLPEIQAAVVNSYFAHFNKMAQAKQKRYLSYRRQISQKCHPSQVRVLNSDLQSNPNVHLMVIAAQKRDELRHYLTSKGIETHIHYPLPVHRVAGLRRHVSSGVYFPVAEKLSRQIISLPFHPYLTQQSIRTIVDHLARFYRS